MALTCATRRVKHAKHLLRTAPHLFPREEPLAGFVSLVPPEILDSLHRAVRPKGPEAPKAVAEWLRSHPVPRPQAEPKEPLFNGTLYFVKVTFATPSGSVSIAESDIATAVRFAGLAAPPISRYAAQYGPNGIQVSTARLPYGVHLAGTQYNDQTLQGWVNAIVSQNSLPPNSCIVILNPQGVVNTDADPSQGVGGYHSLASVPYCFVNVMGTNLTVADPTGVYALALSHEIAEMTVDPRADLGNPECCDGCGPNCQTAWIDYFDERGGYLATSQSFPPSSPYAFFINAIARPASATACPAPGNSCAYPPP